MSAVLKKTASNKQERGIYGEIGHSYKSAFEPYFISSESSADSVKTCKTLERFCKKKWISQNWTTFSAAFNWKLAQ
jgi:hypothetical protein